MSLPQSGAAPVSNETAALTVVRRLKFPRFSQSPFSEHEWAGSVGEDGPHRTLTEYSPSLQMFRDMLHIAWSGTQNHCLNVLSPANSRQPPASRKMTLCSETTEFSPALASFRGYLYLAWTGPDRRLNLVPSE